MQLYFTLSTSFDEPTLQREWEALYAPHQYPFFLNWNWIKAWLITQAQRPLLVRVIDESGRVRGLSLWHSHIEKRKGMRVKQMVLHGTGDPMRDIITIEYNNILCAPNDQTEVWKTTLHALETMPNWDELVLLGMAEKNVPSSKYTTHLRASSPSYEINLAILDVQYPLESYLNSLSRNLRGQIRAALRQNLGLKIEVAQTADQAWEWLEQAQPLHRARWGLAAMDCPAYRAFHQELLPKAFLKGQIAVLRSMAGTLYLFTSAGKVGFYFGAFDYAYAKPGICMHALAIAWAVEQGYKSYDFMAGDARYKQSLGQCGPQIVTIALQRPRLKLKLESALRKIKVRLLRESG